MTDTSPDADRPPPRPGILKRLQPLNRVRESRRTAWQLANLYRCGWSGFRLAEAEISVKRCLQRKWELVGLMGLVRKLRPAVVVEIGTYKGGTLHCWAHVCPPTTTFVSIDLPGGAFGGGSSEHEAAGFQAFLKPGQVLHTIRADSHAPATREEAEKYLAGRHVDFLFIDGDHTYEGVKSDYELYSGLVRPGGLIAFHDIVVHTANPECRVHEFWAELRARGPFQEFVDRDGYEHWGGIGVVRRPAGGRG